jgi:hypothetical protein
MFRTPYCHHQEDYIVHAKFYGMFLMQLSTSFKLIDCLSKCMKWCGEIYRLQVNLERTHAQKNKINRLNNKRDQLLMGKNIPSVYIKQITRLQSGNQSDMELRNRTVGLHQQVQHIRHAQSPIRKSQSHRKYTSVCNKSYSTHRLQHHLLGDVIHERINKNHNDLEPNPNPTFEPLLRPMNFRRLKRRWPLNLQVTWSDIARWKTYHVIEIHGIVAYCVLSSH